MSPVMRDPKTGRFLPKNKQVKSKVSKKKVISKIVNNLSSTLKSVSKPQKVKQMINYIGLVIDKSASMRGLRNKTIEVINNQLDVIAKESQTSGQKTIVKLFQFGEDFNAGNSNLAENMNHLNLNDYNPDEGCTRLRDAVGFAISDFSSINVNPENDVSFLLITITDGQENASQVYTESMIHSAIKTKQATDRWTFVFSVPCGSSKYIERQFGVPQGNIQEWEQTVSGLTTVSNSYTAGTQSYYASRSLGKKSVSNFFKVDMSQVNTSDLKKLQALNNQFKQFEVKKEVDIRPFVESNGFNYTKGNAYYQLTKREKVQDYKDIIIKDNLTGKLYGGQEARQILGMPLSGDTNVHPGNFMNYSIFIQSTSVNRKLVRGTTLLYKL